MLNLEHIASVRSSQRQRESEDWEKIIGSKAKTKITWKENNSLDLKCSNTKKYKTKFQ